LKYFVSLLLYRLLLLTLTPIIFSFFIIKSRKNAALRHRLTERLGLVPRSLKSSGIIVHASSIGEVIALKPFIEKLLVSYPQLPITLTTYTPTGSEQVKKLFAERVQHCYLPVDIFICTALFLKKLKPQAMVFMETEIWPNLIAQAANKKIKLILVNARLSEPSLKNYKNLTWLIKPSLNNFDKILPQSKINLSNFIELGADNWRCNVVGNLKFDISNNANIEEKKVELSAFLPINRSIWLVASTHQGDEELVLRAFKKIIKTQPDLLLILVPRHPERFESVAKLCLMHQLSLVKRSEQKQVTESTHVWLLDSLGELMAAYALADIVTMGGSFNEVNGHNPLEPALFKKAIIVGPFMANFLEIEQQLNHVNGLIQLTSVDVDELTQAVDSLIVDKLKQKRLGDNAYQVVQDNQGASEQSMMHLQALIADSTIMTSVHFDNTFCQYDPRLLADFDPQMLSSHYWQQKKAIAGSAQGRGTTWFIHHQEQHWVLRHYYRGGLIGKFNKDHYIFTSQKSTRAAKEFRLLNVMQTWQLPSPKPIAYRVIRQGLCYQADLLSSRINNARDLVAILAKQPLADDVWFSIGQTIKRFHDRGIYHHDLNAHNILLDDNDKPWLIDFDQGELRPINKNWQQGNMQRLLRSFRKEHSKLDNFLWQEENWQILLTGYDT
jgi:3-deoxy-D-manno-octulosonic-acid transferase